MHHTARPPATHFGGTGMPSGLGVPPSHVGAHAQQQQQQQQQVGGGVGGGGSVDGVPQGVMVQGSAQHMQFLQQQQAQQQAQAQAQQQQQQGGIPMHHPQPRHVMAMPGMSARPPGMPQSQQAGMQNAQPNGGGGGMQAPSPHLGGGAGTPSSSANGASQAHQQQLQQQQQQLQRQQLQQQQLQQMQMQAAAAAGRGHTPQRFPSGAPQPAPGMQQAAQEHETQVAVDNFPPGAATIRLLQYSEALGLGPDRQTLEYWKSFVDEFYMPNGTFHYVLWNPSSREQKGFEIPTTVLPRWLLTNYISGIKSGNISLENPREYVAGHVPFPPPSPHFPTGALGTSTSKFIANLTPSPAVTHLVETTRATFFATFENGWHVQQFGSLRCTFVPHARLVGPSALGPDGMAMAAGPARLETKLRLESFDYSCVAHNSWLPLSLLQNVKVEQRVPPDVVAAILAANGQDAKAQPKKTPRKMTGAARREKEEKERAEGKDDEGKEDEGFSFFVEKIQDLPESPVNEYGITLRAMRCLEITESVCHLRDLMDFAAREKLGPIEGLRKLAAQYRTGPAVSANGTGNAAGGQSPSVRGGSGESAVASSSAIGGSGANASSGGDAAPGGGGGGTEETSPDVVQDGPPTGAGATATPAGTKRKGAPGAGRGGKNVQQSPRVGANKRQK